MTIGTTTLIAIFGLFITILSVSFAIYFGLKSCKRSDNSEVEKKATETATVNVKLDQIGSDVRDIKYDITGVKKDFQALSERVVKVEESAKQAHHRIDDVVEGQGK